MGYWHSFKHFSLMAIAATTVTLSTGLAAHAKTPDTAPETLTSLLTELDTAANEHQLEALLDLYSPEFMHSDGLDKAEYSTFLSELWVDYPRMSYDTKLVSWEQDGDRLIAETMTTIRGIKKDAGRWSHLTSTMRTQQTFANNQLIEQEILSESSELTSGDNPPVVRVIIPETVAPKEDFGFDVIVNDPLGDEILLGGALEEIIGSKTYADPEAFELDILPSGGIFKRVEAPEETGDVWYSAIIVRSDGITLISRRVKVQES
ncbi:MAG: nuclear transport factor 2 family protein [Limnothrix sp.]